MPNLTLVSHDLCPYVQRAIVVLAEKSIPHERRYIDLGDKPDWFRELSPLGKVPLLQVDGTVIFESAVICEYLDEITPGSLHPDDPLQKAQHRAWIEFASAILNDIAGFYNAGDADAFLEKQDRLVARFEWLEQQLTAASYFAGEDFSMVDASFGPVFRYFDTFEAPCGLNLLSRFAKVGEWRRALSDRASVTEAVDAGYPDRLAAFLAIRKSHISTMVRR
jgi:glutathione S-transferase